jgi:hypothetical protein
LSPNVQRLLPNQPGVVTVPGWVEPKNHLVESFETFEPASGQTPGYGKPIARGATFQGFTLVQDLQAPDATVYVIRPGEPVAAFPHTELTSGKAFHSKESFIELQPEGSHEGDGPHQRFFCKGGTEVWTVNPDAGNVAREQLPETSAHHYSVSRHGLLGHPGTEAWYDGPDKCNYDTRYDQAVATSGNAIYFPDGLAMVAYVHPESVPV